MQLCRIRGCNLEVKCIHFIIEALNLFTLMKRAVRNLEILVLIHSRKGKLKSTKASKPLFLLPCFSITILSFWYMFFLILASEKLNKNSSIIIIIIIIIITNKRVSRRSQKLNWTERKKSPYKEMKLKINTNFNFLFSQFAGLNNE